MNAETKYKKEVLAMKFALKDQTGIQIKYVSLVYSGYGDKPDIAVRNMVEKLLEQVSEIASVDLKL